MAGNKTCEDWLAAHPQVEIFEAILPDINGRLRGKWIARDKISKAFSGGLKLPLSTLTFDVWGRDCEASVFDEGDADGICVPESRTFAEVPWLPRKTGQVLLSLDNADGTPCAYDPRNILRNLTERFQSAHGFTPVMASEMEFYLFEKHPDANGQPVHTQTEFDGTPAVGGQTYGIESMQVVGELMHAIRDASLAQDLPIDTLIAEAAPSQYEINLFHQADPLLAADQSLLLQRAIKGVATQFGKRASFMAKPFADLAGNGMHVHASLVDADGANVFDNQSDEGSDMLRHAIAGCLTSMADCMVLFAPHMNSYRRFQNSAHAPMSPTWGYENRTTALRVPAGNHNAMRLEHRLAGADANAYLVFAAITAGMLHGIEKKLAAPEPVTGDAYAQFERSLPASWEEALAVFEQSDFVREYFGEEFQKLFSQTKRQEMAEFARHITPLEYRAYL